MEWLSQNWFWLLLAGGAVWYFSRGHGGGMMGGCGAHGMAHEGPAQKGASAADDASRQPSAQQSAERAADPGASTDHRRRGGCC